jgi:hypothetical protein
MRLLILSILIMVVIPCSSVFAQGEPCDLNNNGFADLADLVALMNIINGVVAPPYDLPFYDPHFDCDRDGLHLTMNDVSGLGYRLIHGPAWGRGFQWWLPTDTLYIPETEIFPGDFYDVPVYVQTDHPLTFVQFALRYDPELLQVEEFVVSDSLPYQYAVRGYSIDEHKSVIVQLAPTDDEIYYSGHLGNLRVRAMVAAPRELETVIEFFTEPRWAFYNGTCSFDYVHNAPGIQLFFTHPTTVDGVIRIVDSGRLGASALGSAGIALNAYPNPFNSTIEISVELESDSEIDIAVFDLLGREVARLHEGRLPAGMSAVTWRADDQPSGVYFCRVFSNGQEVTRRITLLR